MLRKVRKVRQFRIAPVVFAHAALPVGTNQKEEM